MYLGLFLVKSWFLVKKQQNKKKNKKTKYAFTQKTLMVPSKGKNALTVPSPKSLFEM